MKFLMKIVSNLFAMLIAIALLFGGCVFLVNSGLQEADRAIKANPDAFKVEAPTPMARAMEKGKKDFATSVANDLMDQYEIVRGGNDEMAKSMRAGAVAEMYLQAKDQANYQKWKAIADRHMSNALPSLKN
jgi:hypothetical protein